MKELEQIYEMYKHIVHENPDDYKYLFFKNDEDTYYEFSVDNGQLLKKYHYYDDQNNEFTIKARFYTYLNALRNFNGYPCVLSDVEFFKLKGDIVFHGFKDMKHGKNLLSDFNYHHGNGGAFGTFFSNNPSESLIYTENDLHEREPSRIMKVKILPGKGINIMNLFIIIDAIERNDEAFKESSIYNRFKNDVYKIKDFLKIHENDGFLIKSFERNFLNFQILSTYLGFDYIIKNMTNSNIHYIVLNRNKFAVSSEEFNRFCGGNFTEDIIEK